MEEKSVCYIFQYYYSFRTQLRIPVKLFNLLKYLLYLLGMLTLFAK